MRNNLPVTNTEYEFPEEDMLVSATDLESNIQYCNPAFIETSGYTHEELIGQPHNLIRHPDMPREAFADLWATIRRGHSWTALVKNRRKNGDHYWVRANVTPIVQNGATVGYLSVRTKPAREEIAEAERLYAKMRTQGSDAPRLQYGQLRRRGLPGVYDALRRAVSANGTLIAGAAGPIAITGMTPLTRHLNCGTLIATAAALVLVLTSLPTWFLARRSNRSIARTEQIAARIAAGDLTVQIPHGNLDASAGVGRGLAQLKVSLVAIVTDVRKQIDHMKLATREIASGNMDLSNRTEVQAASLQETAASLEQLTATVKNNSHSARQAHSMVERAQSATRSGCDAVRLAEQTMREISHASNQITAIVTTIDAIAFQTNILALNAAVEAARAGESGKGFAVVAGEVRSLAQRCATATKEIKAIVESNARAAKNGEQSVSRATEQMNEISRVMDGVLTVVQEVAAASQQQSQGIGSINDSVIHLDDTTQQNAALVEEGAATAQNLSGQANVLDEAVRLFTLPFDFRAARGSVAQ